MEKPLQRKTLQKVPRAPKWKLHIQCIVYVWAMLRAGADGDENNDDHDGGDDDCVDHHDNGDGDDDYVDITDDYGNDDDDDGSWA